PKNSAPVCAPVSLPSAKRKCSAHGTRHGDAHPSRRAAAFAMKRAAGDASVSHAPLIGRTDEVTRLVGRLTDALGGTGSTTVLAGEGGVGKTRLAETIVEEATRRGFSVAAGRAYPVESGVPYALFADAFMPLIRTLEPAALATLTRGTDAELGVIIP